MQLIRNVPTERLTFDDGSWVELKTRITVAERKRLAAAAVSFTVDENGRAHPVVDVAMVELAALHLGIVAWSLDDPVTPENIDCLDEGTAQAIKVCLDELWKRRTDDDRKNSSGGGAPLSEEKGEFPPNSDGLQ